MKNELPPSEPPSGMVSSSSLECRNEVGVDNATDERRQLQGSELVDRPDADSRSFVQVDVFWRDSTDEVEHGHQISGALLIEDFCQQDGRFDVKARLLPHFSVQRFLDGFIALECTTEARPTVRMGDPRVLVSVMQQESTILGDEEQHRPAVRNDTRVRFVDVRHLNHGTRAMSRAFAVNHRLSRGRSGRPVVRGGIPTLEIAHHFGIGDRLLKSLGWYSGDCRRAEP
jgi:hypothetical protein